MKAAAPPPVASGQGLTGRPWWPWARRVLLAGFLSLVAWLIYRHARQIQWEEVLASAQAYPVGTLAVCTALAGASMALYSCFDLLGRHYTGHGLPVRSVLKVTFISYAFNLNLGSLVGGIGFRYRLYSRLGLDMGQVTRVMSLSMVTNWLGYLLLAGGLFMWHPLPLPAQWKIDMWGLQVLGAALLLLACSYLLLCAFSSRREFHVRRHQVELPSWRMALLQAGMGMANWLLLGSLLMWLMPPSVSFATVQLVLLLAAMAGVLTHVPAGLGVLEAVFISLLKDVPAHELLAALLTYRLIYYLLPFAVAVVLYLFTEARTR